MARRVLDGCEDEIVRARVEEGMLLREIAARFGCSVSPIQRILERAEVPERNMRSRVAGHEQAVAAAYVAGATLRDLAARYGSSVLTIRRVLRDQNVSTRPTGGRRGPSGRFEPRANASDRPITPHPTNRESDAPAMARGLNGEPW